MNRSEVLTSRSILAGTRFVQRGRGSLFGLPRAHPNHFLNTDTKQMESLDWRVGYWTERIQNFDAPLIRGAKKFGRKNSDAKRFAF